MSAHHGQEPGSRLGVEMVPARTAQEPVTQVPRRPVLREHPFNTGMLVAGVAAGVPASVVYGLDGQLGAIALPAAAVAVGWHWWRREGWAGIREDLSKPLLRPGEWRQAAAGAATMLAALYGVFGGGIR